MGVFEGACERVRRNTFFQTSQSVDYLSSSFFFILYVNLLFPHHHHHHKLSLSLDNHKDDDVTVAGVVGMLLIAFFFLSLSLIRILKNNKINKFELAAATAHIYVYA